MSESRKGHSWKGQSWNDIHRANPGAIRRASDDPATDIAFDDRPPEQNGHAKDTRNPADLDYVPPGEPWPNGPDARSPKKPPSRVIDAGTFMRTYVPISYTVDGLLPSGFLYTLTARTGAGKTAFAQALTFAVTMNKPHIIGADVEPGRVAYLTMENPDDFKMKLAVGCHVHGISWDELGPRLSIIECRDTPEQIAEGLRLDAEANGPFQLVIVDTLQAGFSAAGGGKFNENEAILAYAMRLRPLTVLPGRPSVLILCHPTKYAKEDDLLPYGGGAIVNEIDGNLTLWRTTQIKLHHTDKLRSPTFEPRFFRTELCSCPEIVDKKGRQILLPVIWPSTEADAEERKTQEGNAELALLKAMIENEEGSQREWGLKIGKRQSSIGSLLKKLERGKYVSANFGKWRVTTRGRNAVK